MPKVVLTAHLINHAGGLEFTVAGATVRKALFAIRPLLRGYLLDDQGALRHHVVAFVNGEVVHNKQTLDHSVPPDGEVYLLQALSGG
jgi:sulfur carrier protein ThiS